jgi:Ca-activated chloride channel family protein
MKPQTIIRAHWGWVLLFLVFWVSAKFGEAGGGQSASGALQSKETGSGQAPRRMEIDLDRAMPVNLPNPTGLKPVAFKTPDGKEGWALRIPGGRPIATPAFADGMIFVGGGYGSHEFYAFDARTGAVVWQIKTSDDGPTAAVVEEGRVAFNTESCTLIVVDAKTGKVIWQKWLGDPLMSQPAIYKGRIYIAYPAGQRGGQAPKSSAGTKGPRTSHRFACFDLKTGKLIWEQDITGDVISAPVIEEGVVYITCFDGTSFALDAYDGHILWRKAHAGTSAPVVAQGLVVQTRKEIHHGKSYEGVIRMEAKQGREKDKQMLAREEAEYIAEGKGGGVGLSTQAVQTLDSSVGFATAPAAAKLGDASKNVGVTSVVGGWAYQGSRAALSQGQILNAQGRYLNSLRASDGSLIWRAEIKGKDVNAAGQVFAPPALGHERMYLAGPAGFLVAVRQADGQVAFLYHLNRPAVFQPALANGNIYLGTADGMVICLKTGSRDADGWYAWGGNAQHNK